MGARRGEFLDSRILSLKLSLNPFQACYKTVRANVTFVPPLYSNGFSSYIYFAGWHEMYAHQLVERCRRRCHHSGNCGPMPNRLLLWMVCQPEEDQLHRQGVAELDIDTNWKGFNSRGRAIERKGLSRGAHKSICRLSVVVAVTPDAVEPVCVYSFFLISRHVSLSSK